MDICKATNINLFVQLNRDREYKSNQGHLDRQAYCTYEMLLIITASTVLA